MSNVLALQLGHNATALLCVDGKIEGVVSQEKFDNIKNSAAFPSDAIFWLLKTARISADEIDKIAICGLNVFPHQMATTPIAGGGKKSASWKTLLRGLKHWFDYYHFGSLPQRFISSAANWVAARRNEESRLQLKSILRDMNLPADRIEYVEHHLCHSFSPVTFFDPAEKDWLVLTMDGSGDHYFCSVNVWKDGRMGRVSSTPWHNSLGLMYTKTTQYLGMKALEHEYKVMGLAAYAKEKYFLDLYERVFKPVFKFSEQDRLKFKASFSMLQFDRYLKQNAPCERFDNVAGAAQKLLEENVIEWVHRSVKETGVGNVMLSGGVFMNVKLNQKISDLTEVEDLLVMPSCGDESNPIGAVGALAVLEGRIIPSTPQSTIYLGQEFQESEIEDFIKDQQIEDLYEVHRYDDIEEKIAELLSEFHVVGRVAGRAEFGARSLGNRAILANPTDMKSFFEVNDLIKARDFWMPFAPSVLDSSVEKYLHNARERTSPHMMLAFDTTPEGRDHLRAAIHQGDFTARPQIVRRHENERYYRLIEAFKAITGVGAVLNTSLNIHGYPLAATLEQALFTFEKSGLKYLALEHALLKKRDG
jgi:carbamoyltransferase